jgi:hypothetical protein
VDSDSRRVESKNTLQKPGNAGTDIFLKPEAIKDFSLIAFFIIDHRDGEVVN